MYRESTENYLETIYILLQRMKAVRSIDVCSEMGYSKPTISVVMKQFREKGYVEMDGSGYITLTPLGLEIAQRIYERHVVLSELLMMLGVERETALADACKIEHDISEETFACIKRHMARCRGCQGLAGGEDVSTTDSGKCQGENEQEAKICQRKPG